MVPCANVNEVPLGLYLHVPFCVERCHYCYYRSYAKPTPAQIEQYIDALLTELKQYASTPAIAHRPLDFAYFGGGTPSLLSAAQIERLLGGVKALFPWNHAREISFECAPKSVTADRLAALRAAGVTRLSVGVQQMDDVVLAKSGRVHRVADVERAWGLIEPLAFPVVNLDLMVGLVGETDESFFSGLQRVISFSPMSVTIYLLEIPRNTPLYHALQTQQLSDSLVVWEVKRRRLAAAFTELERHGYVVRSAYSAVRDPQQGRFIYQEAQYHGADLLGAGVASFSYIGGVHFQNHAALERYLDCIAAGNPARARAYSLTDQDRMVREFVLQLKLGGVRRNEFERKFGVSIEQQFGASLQEFTKRQWLHVDADGVTLSREGLLRVDRLIPACYLPPHREQTYW